MGRVPTRPIALLALCAVATLACGVGDVREEQFFFAPLTADGGTIDIGTVRLVLPPGALPAPTAVSLLPETQDLPIVADPQDPATYEVFDARHCAGPRGLALLRGARLSVVYDPAGLPAGSDEAEDLVLLLWDEALGALVPDLDAVQDVGTNTFTIDDYDELGHLAIGLASRPPSPGFVFLSGDRAGRLGSTIEAVVPDDGLYLGDLDGGAPVLLPGGPEFPVSFLPSPDGARVLFELFVFEGGQDFPTTQLWTTAEGAASATLLVGEDEFVTSFDPTHGWLRQTGDVHFQEILLADPGQNLPDRTVVSTVGPAGDEAPATLASFGQLVFVADVRQSPNGRYLLVRFTANEDLQAIAVLEVPTRQIVSIGDIPVGGGQATPRFLPDSSGVYLVSDDRTQVLVYDPDGTGPSVLFDLPTDQGQLDDFVLGPDGDDYAYVARLAAPVVEGPALVQPGNDGLRVGSLSGGERGDFDLGGDFFYDELAFHPDGATVFLDGFFTGLRLFDADDASQGPDLPVTGLSKVDIHRQDGRLLLVVGDDAALDPGVYVAEADGTQIQPVPLPATFDVLEARWLETTRTAPCMGFVNRFR